MCKLRPGDEDSVTRTRTACYRHQLFIENPAYAATSRAQARESKRHRRREDAEWAERERERDTARRRAQGKPPRGPGLTDMPCSLREHLPLHGEGLVSALLQPSPNAGNPGGRSRR